MADNVPITKGEGTTISTEEVSNLNGGVVASQHVQRVISSLRTADGTANDVSTSNPIPISDSGGSVTVDSPALGEIADAEAIGNGSLIALLKRLRKLFEGTGVVKVSKVEEALPAGANAIGKLAANSGVDIGDVDVTSLTGSTVAHDAADAGNPHKIGGRARTSLPASVAQDDRVDGVFDKYGRQLTTIAPPDTRVSGTVTLENENSTEVLAAPGAGVRLVVTAIKVVNAGAVSGRIEILDEATKKDVGYAVKEGGGWSIADPNGLFIVTTNKPVKAKALATSKFDVFITAYKLPE